VTNGAAPVYLDYNATAPLLPVAHDAMIAAMAFVGNPSSVHAHGRSVRKMVEEARRSVADLVHCDATHVTFTSGATEANQTVLRGAPVDRILVSAIEHTAVLENAPNATIIPVHHDGVVDINALENALKNGTGRALVSVMWVNNETGVIQPVEKIAALCAQYNALFHCDAVQAAGRIPIDLGAIRIHYLTLSAHKMGGPAGIGALIYDHETPLHVLVRGGGQERRRRAGTENIIGIAGFGAAAQAARNGFAAYEKLGVMRDALEQKMRDTIPACVIAGANAPRVNNTIQVMLPGAPSETQLMALDLGGVSVSSGAACSSGSVKPSHVLRAMGVPEPLARCAIRVSMGPDTAQSDLDRFFQVWVANWQRLNQT
jgi:cysteine desulfurase